MGKERRALMRKLDFKLLKLNMMGEDRGVRP
jgi:hypothetical protein